MKYVGNLAVTDTTKIIAMRNLWLVQQSKTIAKTKAWFKKAADAEKKEREKANKPKEKSQQQQDIRQLAIINRQQIGSFGAIFSDPYTKAASSNLS